MQPDRLFHFYTKHGELSLNLYCGEAKVIGRLEGRVNQPSKARLNPLQTGKDPDEAQRPVGPEPFEAETVDLVVEAARRWITERLGPIESIQERGCEPD